MNFSFVKGKFLISGKKPPLYAALKQDKKFTRAQMHICNTFHFVKIKNKNWLKKFYLILSGMAIGLLNGFFGGGGGMVCVPILEKVLKLESKQAHATAILVILPISLISAFIYVYNGQISTIPLLIVGSGVIAGGILGCYILKVLPPKAIKIIFAIVMFAGGIKLII